MSRDALVYLEDILDAASRIESYLTGVDRNRFLSDTLLQDATIRNLEVIGEAAKSVPEATRLQIPDIEWRKIAGVRDVLIHDYAGVDLEVVWDAVTSKVPTLAHSIRSYLDSVSAE